MNFSIRPARLSDIPELEALIPLSAKILQAEHYSQALIEAALGPIFAVDSQLIEDETYFVAEAEGRIVGCGGWTKRNRPYGGNGGNTLLDPDKDAAVIRAFFVHPDFARRGIGKALMQASEQAAVSAGFSQIDMVATLTGELLYSKFGYEVSDRYTIPTSTDEHMPVVKMSKRFR